MLALISWCLANKAFLLTALALIISEVLPFVKSTGWNGLLQGLLSAINRYRGVATAATVIALVALSSVAACAWGKAFVASEKACQLGLVPAEEQSGLAAVTAALADPVAWEADLLNLAGQLGAEQVNCLVMAVEAGIKAVESADGGVAAPRHLLGLSESQSALIVANADAWLAHHSGR